MNREDVVLIIVLIIVAAIVGVGLGRAYYGIPGVTQRFEAEDIVVNYGIPRSGSYTCSLHVTDKNDFYYFMGEYNVTEVWIKRGPVLYFAFIEGGVKYWW